MSHDPAFVALMDELRRGDADAAQQIFRRYRRRLMALAELHLNDRLRQKVDPEDIAQSAFRSFFVRLADGQFDLNDWGSLWSLLTIITLRKCGYRVRHFRAARRDVRREAAPAGDQEDPVAAWQPVAREPTPVEAAMLAETVEELFRGLDEPHRCILELGLQGHSAAAISKQTEIAERTVYRVLERVKRKLERLSGTADEA